MITLQGIAPIHSVDALVPPTREAPAELMQPRTARGLAALPNPHSPHRSTLSELRKVPEPSDHELREVFQRFVGETFFGHLLAAMRKTVGKPAYMHGGRAEEVFQAQLDQVLSEHMTAASAESFAGPMFELFQLNRQ